MTAPTPIPARDENCRHALLTGASGYLGGRIKRKLLAEGWQVTELGRHAVGVAGGIPFRLGEPIAPEKLAGHSALIHCAYDFRKHGWEEIHQANVRGSEMLLRAARQAGVRRLVFISSISAFAGCRSHYGRAKLEVEAITQSLGGWNIRPGLVYGDEPGGMVGRLVKQVQSARIIPLPGGGRQKQYLVHDADLSEAVFRCVNQDAPKESTPVTVAHAQPWSLREILTEIARQLHRRVWFVPVPWRCVWAGLRLAEGLHLPLSFRSDSLVSMVYQNPKPVFNSLEKLGVPCRLFQWRPAAPAINPKQASA